MSLRKRTVDKIVKDSFWEGFQSGLGNGPCGCLEYGSTSGYYSYNGVRRIAERAGYDLAQQVLADHVKHLAGEGPRFSMGFNYKIPGKVWAECYGEAQLAVKP